MADLASSPRPSVDAEVFFTSVAGMSAALLAGELVFRWLAASADGPLGASLLARTAALTSVRPLYAMFVLLPAGLAFLTIGVPFFLRVLTAGFRGRLETGTRIPLMALGICTTAALIELRMDYNGILAVSAALLVSAHAARAALARFGEKRGYLLLLAAGLSLGALAWYESRMAIGSEASIALAPTALVAAAFFTTIALVTASAAALLGSGEGRISIALCWAMLAACAAAPLMRSRLAETAAAADQWELRLSLAAAVVFFGIGVARRLRS